jgi:glycosyltransferase involved in cell wall biosynthesis
MPRNLAADPPVRLLAVGSIVPRKGYRDLVAALGMLADVPWTLTIAGDDTRHVEEATALRELIASSPVAGRIDLRGALSNTALSDLYTSADAFVMSSLYEGYGMVLSEALAHGLPIVSTRAGAAAETVPDEAALKVEPGDIAALSQALRRVIVDTALRKRLAESSWAAGQRLPQWQDTARRIADVVAKVARERQ